MAARGADLGSEVDLAALRGLGGRIAALLRRGDLVLLSGPLGAGKSELARAVIRARAGAAIEVPSPSFTLLQRYELPGLVLHHADLYRLSGSGEAAELGLDDAQAEGALLVEWPERVRGWPSDRLEVTLADGPDPQTRFVRLDPRGHWAERAAGLLS